MVLVAVALGVAFDGGRIGVVVYLGVELCGGVLVVVAGIGSL